MKLQGSYMKLLVSWRRCWHEVLSLLFGPCVKGHTATVWHRGDTIWIDLFPTTGTPVLSCCGAPCSVRPSSLEDASEQAAELKPAKAINSSAVRLIQKSELRALMETEKSAGQWSSCCLSSSSRMRFLSAGLLWWRQMRTLLNKPNGWAFGSFRAKITCELYFDCTKLWSDDEHRGNICLIKCENSIKRNHILRFKLHRYLEFPELKKTLVEMPLCIWVRVAAEIR